MKFRLAVLSMLLLVGSVFAQTVSPASASVTFDKSTQTTLTLPSVTLTAPGTSNYWYLASVPNEFAGVITVNPVFGAIAAGLTGTVTFSAGTGINALDVGSYVIPVSFVPLYTSTGQNTLQSIVYTITINVTNSRTYVLPGANDLTIPHLAAGDVWKTRIRLVNTTGTASINELRLFNANGQPATYLVNGFSTNLVPAITVPAHGTVEFIVDAAVLKTGTATIHTSQGSMPGVNVSYICSNPRFESAVEIKPSNSSGFTVAFENNSATRRSTGIAISFDWHKVDQIAAGGAAVPRAVFGRERIIGVLGRELLAGVERHPERSAVRLHQHVGHDHLGLQLRMRAHQASVGIAADVEVRPSVEAAPLHAGHVVGNQVVAEVVAFVGGAPHIAGSRLHVEAHTVADAGGKYFGFR